MCDNCESIGDIAFYHGNFRKIPAGVEIERLINDYEWHKTQLPSALKSLQLEEDEVERLEAELEDYKMIETETHKTVSAIEADNEIMLETLRRAQQECTRLVLSSRELMARIETLQEENRTLNAYLERNIL